MQLRMAAAVDLAQPAEVIEPEVVEMAAVGSDSERVRHLFEQLGGRIADADHTIACRPHRLRHHPDRVGEVDDPGLGREPVDFVRISDHVRDGTRRHREAGRPDRLLADDPVALRRRLVEHAPLDAADADAREHEAGAGDALVDRPAQRDARAAGHPLRHAPDDSQAFVVGIVERDLFDRQIGVRQAVDEQGRAHAGAADDGDFHGPSCVMAVRRAGADPKARLPPGSTAHRRNCRSAGTRAVAVRRARHRGNRR
jgi:hypothetical protein